MTSESNLQSGYQVACDMSVEQFAAAGPEMLSRLCHAEYRAEDKSLLLPYLGDTYIVKWPSGEVAKDGSQEEIPATTKILLLNYVTSANGQEPTGELISFRDIPGAAMYEPSFNKRALSLLLQTFDGKPDLLRACAERLGGESVQVADSSVRIPVLPLLPVTYGIWQGDEEFPATGVILFDTSARKLLSVECLVVAAANGVYAMMKMARNL